MNSDDLIQDLGARFESEKSRVPSRAVLGWIWAFASVLLVALPMAFLALRTDVKQHSVVLGYWIYFASLGISALCLLDLAWLSAIPGKEIPSWLERTALGFGLLGFAGVFQMGLDAFAQGSILDGLAVSGFRCSLTEAGLAVLPSTLFFLVFRKLAPTTLSRTGIWGLGSVALLSSAALALHCASNHPTHILVWHLVPVFLIGLLGAFFSRRVLSW